MSFEQSTLRRESLCIAGGSAEPIVPVAKLLNAIDENQVEIFRPLLPVGYREVATAYKKAVENVSVDDLTSHYTDGLQFFQQQFTPYIKKLLQQLSGGAWCLDEYEAFAAGSDVDMMSHIVEAIAAHGKVALFPSDWYGFLVGSTQQQNIQWTEDSRNALACLCIPSVRNGHLTEEMYSFLETAENCLLNINLYPTMAPQERQEIATALNKVLHKSVISISFSRGFGLTSSQLGVILIHRDHPWKQRFATQWNWFTYFYNALAAKAFMAVDVDAIQKVDAQRRTWVNNWLHERDLPVVESGTYYVKSFRVSGQVPEYLQPLMRNDVMRLCFKPVDYT